MAVTLTTFTPGTVAKSSEVNTNFTNLRDRSDIGASGSELTVNGTLAITEQPYYESEKRSGLTTAAHNTLTNLDLSTADNIDFNVGSMYDAGDTIRVTVADAGIYKAEFYTAWSPNGVGHRRGAILATRASYADLQNRGNANSVSTGLGTATYAGMQSYMEAGDSYRFQYYQNSGGNLDFNWSVSVYKLP